MKLPLQNMPAVLCFASVGLLSSCEGGGDTVQVDPQLGRACFEMQRNSLPPGSQYEGIASATGEQLTIKVMDGTGVATRNCPLDANGQLVTAASGDTGK